MRSSSSIEDCIASIEFSGPAEQSNGIASTLPPPPKTLQGRAPAEADEFGGDGEEVFSPGSKAARLLERFRKGFANLSSEGCDSVAAVELSEKGKLAFAFEASDSEESFRSDEADTWAEPFSADKVAGLASIKSVSGVPKVKSAEPEELPADPSASAPPAADKPPGPAIDPPPAFVPPVPAPPPPAPAFARPRVNRAIQWGPFQLAPLCPGPTGKQTGWGATCGKHKSPFVKSACRKNLTYGGARVLRLDDDACIRQLKRWLLRGLAIDFTKADGKEEHGNIDARMIGPVSDPEDLETPPVLPGVDP